MKLVENEVLVKDFKVFEGTIGCQKTKRSVMVSFTKEQDTFEYVDVFLTKLQVKELIIELTKKL